MSFIVRHIFLLKISVPQVEEPLISVHVIARSNHVFDDPRISIAMPLPRPGPLVLSYLRTMTPCLTTHLPALYTERFFGTDTTASGICPASSTTKSALAFSRNP